VRAARLQVTPPRAIDGLRLNATDLRQLDGPRVLELKAPLTNRYRVALAYPSLELTLLDDTNHVTVRRVLARATTSARARRSTQGYRPARRRRWSCGSTRTARAHRISASRSSIRDASRACAPSQPARRTGALEHEHEQGYAGWQPDRYRRHVPGRRLASPDFKLVGKDLADLTLASFAGKRKVLNIVPSLDTPTCATSTRKFNEAASSLDNTVVIVVSGATCRSRPRASARPKASRTS
jgi:hypothetical protein